MTQESGLYNLFKRALAVCLASLICSFLVIEGAWAAVVPPPPPPPDATVPAGGPLGYLALISGIVLYARWSKKRSRNRPPEDEK